MNSQVQRPHSRSREMSAERSRSSYLQSTAHAPLSDAALDIHMTPWRGEVGQGAFYRQIAQMDQRYTDEIESRYAPLGCPISILWGDQDEWVPITRGRRLADALTGGVLTSIPGAGHLVQEDAPEAIVAAMLDRPA